MPRRTKYIEDGKFLLFHLTLVDATATSVSCLMIATSLRVLLNGKDSEIEVLTSGTETMGPKVKFRKIAATRTNAECRGIEKKGMSMLV